MPHFLGVLDVSAKAAAKAVDRPRQVIDELTKGLGVASLSGADQGPLFSAGEPEQRGNGASARTCAAFGRPRSARESFFGLTAAAVIVGGVVILFDPIFQGLAVALIGGEVAATVLSRMAVPVLYYLARRGDAASTPGVEPPAFRVPVVPGGSDS